MNVKHLAEVISRQRVAFISVLIIGVAAFIVTLPLLRTYTATSSLMAAAASAQQTSVLDPTKDPTSSAVGLTDLEDLATSAVIINRVVADLHLSAEDAKHFSSEVKAKSLFESNILPIQVSDRNPNRAVQAANAMASELSAYARGISTSRYDQLIADLNRQISEQKHQLGQVDSEIQSLSSANYYIAPDTGTAAINTRLVALDAQRQVLQATVDGDSANALVFSKRPRLSAHLAAHEIVTQDPTFTALKGQYGKDLASLNNIKASYTDRFPGIAGLQTTVDRENKSLQDAESAETKDPTQSPAYVAALLDSNRADATLRMDRAQLSAVQGQIAELRSQLASSSGQGVQIAELRRERAAGEVAFQQLSSQLALAVADRDQADTVGSVVVVDRATFAPPSLLGRPGVLATAFTIAFLWLAVTLAFMLDGSDKRLRNKTTIEDLYGKPVFNSVG
jgi:capsular polysaccharide biosynthesis protein